MRKKTSSIRKRLYALVAACLVPLAVMIVYLLMMVNDFSQRYDEIVTKITMANEYSTDFKEDMDYVMYVIVVNAERAGELVDTEQPETMINDARETFTILQSQADDDISRTQTQRILKNLNTLEDRVSEIKNDALLEGYYDINMERLDSNIRVLTELTQEQIQQYIAHESENMAVLQNQASADVTRLIQIVSVLFVLILILALMISRYIMTSITKPIGELTRVTQEAGRGDFSVRAPIGEDDEIAQLSKSFNQMIEQLGDLVEDIRVEQLNLRATELRLFQAQINPHFLYNTLDVIMWLAEAGETDKVKQVVTSLSEFFRTTLSNGKDYITVQEEELHVRSYLEIQQIRYQDILEYEIQIPEEMYTYKILKLTLQPLVENALYHGIKNKRGLGHIRVLGEQQGETLLFTITDDGIGMTPERLAYVQGLLDGSQRDTESSSGFGLFNVQQRLQLNYGKEYGISMTSEPGEGTRVVVTIPAHETEPESNEIEPLS